jgi:4-hydroxybenzoate polyprenyltransferase
MSDRLRLLLELIRFSHTIFALPFALISALLAWQEEPFRWLDLIGVLLCMVFARSAAMAFNRLADRNLDAINPRTSGRHLPVGAIRPQTVGLFAGASGLAFIATTLLFTPSGNYWPLYLSLPVLLFIGLYSFTKRFTSLAHFWLGASLMLAPLSTWVAIKGMNHLIVPSVLGLAVMFWVAGFDIIYACQDAEFDRRAKLFSLPARIGVAASLRLAGLCHLVMLGLLIGLYLTCDSLGLIYLIGLAGVTGVLLYEHWVVKPDDLSRVNQAFFLANGVVSLGLLAVVALQLTVGAWRPGS